MTARRKPPNAGKGRIKGVPNRVTADVREGIRHLLESNAPRMQEWLDHVAEEDPARALELLVKLAEFVVPRLSRIQATDDREPVRQERAVRFV